MTDEKTVAKAIEWARYYHRAQVDDDGKPHFAHCDAVAKLVMQVWPKHNAAIAAAYLHDILEDCPEVNEVNLRQNFGDIITGYVVELTKDEKGNFPNLRSTEAMVIKFADRMHNLSRMNPWPPGRRSAYKRKSVFWHD
jgi:GTP pyrophosphokinase